MIPTKRSLSVVHTELSIWYPDFSLVFPFPRAAGQSVISTYPEVVARTSFSETKSIGADHPHTFGSKPTKDRALTLIYKHAKDTL